MADPHGSGLDAGREALRRFLAGDDDLQSMLSKITLIAAETIPGVDAASITMLVAAREPKTPAYSDKVAFDLDQVQYDLGDGPCLAAMRHQGVELMTTDPPSEQWPTLSDAARDRGVLAVLSAPLIDRDAAKGALNLYSESGFESEAWEVASRFADQLGIAAVNATLYVEGSLMAQQLHKAMESRAVIEQAKGILMRSENCGPDDAFGILVKASQHRNQKLREVAAEIVHKYSSGPPRVSAPRDEDGSGAQG
jgi:GAF domain-containing protein